MKSLSRLLSLMLCAVMLLCLLPAGASAQELSFADLPESSRSGSWGVEKQLTDGVLNIRFTSQYAEQRYDLPQGLDAASVSKITVDISSGDVGGFCIKLLKGTDQADVAYGTNTIETKGAAFDGIGLMALGENGGEYTLSGISFAVEAKAEPAGAAALKDLYADDFRMGVACEAISHWNNRLSEIGNPDKEALILSQFNSITFGNELKPAYNMNFRSKDATETNLPFGANRAAIEMLDWAKANGMPVRGHTLVWHSQCNDAVFCKEYKPQYHSGNSLLLPECLVDRETMLARLESYINSVMDYMYSHGYGDVIYAWDVVNEAVEPGATPYGLRTSYWYRTIGPDYLMETFRITREAVEKYSAQYADLYGVDANDPEALKTIQPKLFYNDYSEFQATKRDAIIRNVKPIAEAGYLDGIGMQGHLSDTTNIDDYITALKMYSEIVDEVHITELDVTQSSSGPNADYYQAVFYNELFSALLKAKQEGAKLTAVTIWGLTDDNSWKKESNPLIFNGDLTTKLAYDGIVNAKTGAAMPEPEYEAPDFSDGIFTFDEAGADAAKLGFVRRGNGEVAIQRKVSHSGKAAILNSGRTDAWNGTSFDVSRFAGQTIAVHAWVKSAASSVRLTADIDGKWPNITSASTASGDWAEINGIYTIPAELNSLSLYFETSDLSDIYIDDVSIKLVGQDEGFEGETHTALPRGVGHMPVLNAANAEKHTGRKALRVTREAQEATVMFDISKYVGKAVEITAYVKTTDDTIRMGLEGLEQVTEVPAGDGWTEVKGTFTLPSDRTSAQVYIETSGTADYWVDDLSVRIGTVSADFEDGNLIFAPRWQGAGTLQIVDEEDGNHAALLSNQDATYYGMCYDMTPYLGMEVEISFDVKTDDSTVKITGDIDGKWPNYLSARTTPGSWQTVTGTIRFPKDMTSLRVYIETPGTADLYIDNFSIQRAG